METPQSITIAARAATRIERTRLTKLGQDAITLAVSHTADEDLQETMLSLFESPTRTLKVAKRLELATHQPTAKELAQLFADEDSSSETNSDSKSEITLSTGDSDDTTVPLVGFLALVYQLTGVPFMETIYPLLYRLFVRRVPIVNQVAINLQQSAQDAVESTTEHFKVMMRSSLKGIDDRSKRAFAHAYSMYQLAGGKKDIIFFVMPETSEMLATEEDKEQPFMTLLAPEQIHLILKLKLDREADEITVVECLRALAMAAAPTLDYVLFVRQQTRARVILNQYSDVVADLKEKVIIKPLLYILSHDGMRAMLKARDYDSITDLMRATMAYGKKLHGEQQGKARENAAIALQHAPARFSPIPATLPVPSAETAPVPVPPKKGDRDRRDRYATSVFKAASAETPAEDPPTVTVAATKATPTVPVYPFDTPQFRGKKTLRARNLTDASIVNSLMRRLIRAVPSVMTSNSASPCARTRSVTKLAKIILM